MKEKTLDALERAAKLATKGSWKRKAGSTEVVSKTTTGEWTNSRTICECSAPDKANAAQAMRNAEFIAKMSPKMALKLLAEIRRLTAALEKT